MSLTLQLSKLARRLALVHWRRPRAMIALAALGVVFAACTEEYTTLQPLTLPAADTVPQVAPDDPALARTSHIVTAEGLPSNRGDADSPWDLTTALAGAGGRVTAGDTVWIRGGTYRGSFISRVHGVEGAPVLVRAWPDERVVLDHQGAARSTLTVQGAWSIIWGIEVTNTNPARSTLSTSSEWRPNGVVNNASHTRYINLVVHDAGVGFYNYTDAADVEVYGSVFYNNGWQGSDRGHGHALYVKSDVGPVVLRENILFNQFGWGVHAYTNQGTGRLNNIHIDHNVSFDNGTLASRAGAENILLGGNDYSTGSSVTRNVTWFPRGTATANVRIGFGAKANGTVVVDGNLFAGGDPVLRVGQWAGAEFRDNILVGDERMVELNDASLVGYDWSATRQHRDPLSASWSVGGVPAPFLVWRTLSGLGLSDVVAASTPSAPEVQVWPNAYEPGRGTIVIMNWSRQATALVPLDGVIAPGESFEIRSVQDLFGAPLLRGTYGGPITLPMSGVLPPIPIGLTSSRAPRTGPEFDVLIVIRR